MNLNIQKNGTESIRISFYSSEGRRHLNQLSKSMGGSGVYLSHVINLLTGISDLYTTCNYTSVYPTFSRDYVIVDERRH